MSITQPTHSALSALDRAPVWLNTEPLTAEALRRRVVPESNDPSAVGLAGRLAAQRAVRQGAGLGFGAAAVAARLPSRASISADLVPGSAV
jgi:hypothetical protein